MLKEWTPAMRADFALKLQDYHKVFGVFWTLSGIFFTEDSLYCPTAMISLKKRPQITINEAWWNALTPQDHIFVIVHECLHALLKHGIRKGIAEVPNATFEQINKAQDITINEMTESIFGIDRTTLTNWEQYCWVATCFPDDPTVPTTETFVYYLEKLVLDDLTLPGLRLDIHLGGDDDGDDSGVIGTLIGCFDEGELDKICEMAIGPGGSLAGTLVKKETSKRLLIKRFINNLKTSKRDDGDEDAFVGKNRRFAGLPGPLILPNVRHTKPLNDKHRIVLCLDVSGSVAHFRPFFYELRSLFLKEKTFEIKSYVFADRIAEIVSETQAYNVGGGNSPFSIIEDTLLSSKDKYPDAVIVITDGGAGPVKPKYPDRWIWLMTDRYHGASIPTASKRFNISDVVI